MAYDLNQLAGALRGAAEAKGRVNALAPQVQQAQSMADTEYAQPTASTGYVSPMQAIANALRKDRGTKKLRELQPQVASATQQMAEADNASTMYGLQQARDKQTYDRSRNAASDLVAAEERDETKRKFGLTNTLAKQKQSFEEGKRSEIKMQNTYTGELSSGAVGADGTFYIDGSPVSHDEWVEYDKPTSSGSAGGGGRSRAKAEEEAFKIYKRRGDINTIASVASKFTPVEVKELEDLRSRFGNKFLTDITPNSWAQMMEGELSGYSPTIKEFLNKVRSASGEIRHELFGSALTEGETRSSEGFLPAAQGLKLSDIMRRLTMLDKSSVQYLQDLDSAYNETFTGRRNYNALSDYNSLQNTNNVANDQNALAREWASANPNDPRAAEIMARLGGAQ